MHRHGVTLHEVTEAQRLQRIDEHLGRKRSVEENLDLFTRMKADDRAFWFLGPATYRSHKGERPMAITWELEVPLPGDLFASFAAASAACAAR